MDDENEALDWGNEEDEYQESPRRLSHNSHSGRDRGQQDDVEDTISLGDEEEESGFYPYSRHDPAYVKYAGNDPPAGLPSHKNLVATGAKVHNKSQEAPEQSNVKVSVASSESPTRSTRQSSPQRSLPRLTHALPPKPVAPKVPVLPPSHPSIIAATSMTTISPHTAGSEIKKLNGNSGKSTSQQSADDLPQDWETRHSRKGELYYYNRVTHECVWTHPNSVAAPEGTTSRRRSHSASSVGNRQITSHDSNTDHLKTTSDTPHSEPPASEIQAERRLTTSDVHGLTYEDRHYRPGEPVSTEVRLVDRSQNLSNRGRYDGSLSPHRRRPRSNSPASARGTREKEYQDQRSTRGRDTFVNPISPASKVTYVSDLTDDDRFWPPLQHPAKFSRTEREQKERSTRLPREGDQIDNKSGRPVPKKEEIGHERRGRSGDRNPTSSRMSDVPESSANQTYSSAQRTRSPPLYLLRGKGHDIRDQERDLQGQDINRDNRTSTLSRYHGDSPSPIPAADTSRKSRETNRELERNIAERDRHSPRLKHSHGPSDSQELLSYARGREFDRPLDANSSRRRDLARDSGNEHIRRSERERGNDLDMIQRHPHPLREGDDHSPQQPADDYPPEFRVARPGDRLRSAEVTRPHEGVPTRPNRAALPPQQPSFKSTASLKVRDQLPHTPLASGNRFEDHSRISGRPTSDASLPRQPRNVSIASRRLSPDTRSLTSLVDVDRDKYRDKYDPRQRHPGEDASTEMKTNVDMFEVPRSGGKGSPKGDKNPGHEEHNRFEALRSFSHRDDIPPGRPEFSPLEPTTPRSGGVSTYENDNAIDRQPDQRLGSTDDVADRRVQLPQPERNNSRRGKDVPTWPATRLTGTNNIPIGIRNGYQTATTATDKSISPQPATSGTDAARPIPTPIKPPRDLPPGKECYERPPDLVISDPPRWSGPSTRPDLEKSRSQREIGYQQKVPEQSDRGRKRELSPYSGTARLQERNGVNNLRLFPRPVSREPPASAHSAAVERSSSARHLHVGRPDSNKPATTIPPNHYTSAQPTAQRSEDRVPTRGISNESQMNVTPATSHLRQPNKVDASSRRVPSGGDLLPPRLRKSFAGPDALLDSARDRKPETSEDHSSFFDRVERPSIRRGGSLLDRLSGDDGFSVDGKHPQSSSLRDRLVPSKRGLDEMKVESGSSKGDINERSYEPEEGNESKRTRRRGGKNRRSGGGDGGSVAGRRGGGRRIRS